MDIVTISEYLLAPKRVPISPRLDLHIRAVFGGPPQPRKRDVIYYYTEYQPGVCKYIGYSYVDRQGRFVKSIGVVEFCKQNGLWPEK